MKNINKRLLKEQACASHLLEEQPIMTVSLRLRARMEDDNSVGLPDALGTKGSLRKYLSTVSYQPLTLKAAEEINELMNAFFEWSMEHRS